LVNDLTHKSLTEGYAVVYESHFMRTFIHVRDMSKAFLFAIRNKETMKDNVYNVGSDDMNFTKKEICEIIKKELPSTYFNYADVGEDADKRNYKVSYDKIKSLGYSTEVSLKEGIQELIKASKLVKIVSPYHNVVK
jgi:nucleoside-diphosphate-sugar epimerase